MLLAEYSWQPGKKKSWVDDGGKSPDWLFLVDSQENGGKMKISGVTVDWYLLSAVSSMVHVKYDRTSGSHSFFSWYGV